MDKSYVDTRATSKKAKTIVLLTKSDWSNSVMKYGIKSAGESASIHYRPAGAIYSSQSNNQSTNCVSGVCAINVSRVCAINLSGVCAKTLSRIVQRIYLNFTFFFWIQKRKLESKFCKYQEVTHHFKSFGRKNLKKFFGSGRNFLWVECVTFSCESNL